jgi:hypothetical protein
MVQPMEQNVKKERREKDILRNANKQPRSFLES